MVAVKVRQDDSVDAIEIESVDLERDRRGGAAIDQQPRPGSFHPRGGIEPPAGAEGVA